MTIQKKIDFIVNKEIYTFLKNEDINAWIIQEAPQYNPNLTIPPIPYTNKKRIKKTIKEPALSLLKQTPGTSYNQKIMNLYYNKQKRDQKKQEREKILEELFPNHPYLKKQ